MPIKGLTDRGLNFPEIGQIRKGGKKTETAPGRDLNYFRVEIDARETASIEIFKKLYGNEPRDIRIVLPFDEIERVWDAWLEAYNKGRMIARADGDRYIYRISPTGEIMVMFGEPYLKFSKDDVLGTWTEKKSGKVNEIKCKPVGRLKIVIPELTRLAYLTVHTTSYLDIINIQAQLEAIKSINGGKLSGVPLVLSRRPKQVSVPKEDGSSARYEKWMLSIEADPEFVKRMLVTLKESALPGNGLPLLPDTIKPFETTAPNIPQSFATEPEPEEEEEPPFEDAVFSEPDPKPEPIKQSEPDPKPETDNKYQRPLAPAVLVEFLKIKAETHKNDLLPNEKQIGLVVGMANICFAGDPESDNKRHDCLKYLTGSGHTSDISGSMIYALLDWLKPVKDSGDAYIPDPMAVKEMHSVWTASQVNAGQITLPLDQ